MARNNNSLNQIADYVLGELGFDLDYVQRQKAKFAIKMWRAKFLRQDAERNGLDKTFVQYYTDSLVKVDTGSCLVETGVDVLETEHNVPKPVRTKSGQPFKYVGEVGGGQAWTYAEPEEMQYVAYNKYSPNIIRYSYVNGKVRVLGACLPKYIEIADAFEDPSEAVTHCVDSINCFNDDEPFPIGMDMLADIIKAILTTKLKIDEGDEEVTVDAPKTNV